MKSLNVYSVSYSVGNSEHQSVKVAAESPEQARELAAKNIKAVHDADFEFRGGPSQLIEGVLFEDSVSESPMVENTTVTADTDPVPAASPDASAPTGDASTGNDANGAIQ